MAKKPLNLKPQKAKSESQANHKNPWKILIVDDEPQVHSVTQMTLATITFRSRPVKMLSCYSAAEAQKLLTTEKNIALILLDVVMESEHAGLDLVKFLRNDLNNRATRIILRTGQPGQAPEQRVIVDYDINDYKSKTDLTATKLFTAVIASLRSYADIVALETSQQGLEQIIEASDQLLKFRSLNEFASGLLTQLSAFMGCQPNGILFHFGHQRQAELPWLPKACSGEFAACLECVPENTRERKCDFHTHITHLVEKAIESKQHIYEADFTALYMDIGQDEDVVSVIHSSAPLNQMDRRLLEVFASKMSIGFQNLRLYENLEERVKQRTAELEKANQELTRLATTDTLTGALNRRAFMDAMHAEIERSRRYQHPMSILIIDVDLFKSINDTYGHMVGDDVLCNLTQIAKNTIRECDHFARFGGEEFAVLLPESDRKTALQAAERIRQTIFENRLITNEEEIAVSVSIGVAEIMETNGNGDKLISLADKRLYRAKEQGRNRCVAD